MNTVLEKQKAKVLASRAKLDAFHPTSISVSWLPAPRKTSQVFYILCGWMTEKDAAAFQKDIENDANLYCIIEDDENNILTSRLPS